MQIILAKTAGFCFGVNRAVSTLENLLNQSEKVCTLGPIIHNDQVVSDFSNRGVLIVDSVDEVPRDYTLVIRSHGVSSKTLAQLEERKISYVDATCPFVKKIHNIVEKESQQGRFILVAGDENHPEVQGIVGWCKGGWDVFSDEEELEKSIKKIPNYQDFPISVVAQTTFHKKTWKKSLNSLKKLCTNAKIFDTICSATSERQAECESLSKMADAMIVIGGRHSSNSAKLRDVSAENCKTFFVETAAELDFEQFKDARIVGITAGASTPGGIIKEVLVTMSENVNPVAENQVDEVAVEAVETPAPEQAAKKSFEEMTFEEALEDSLSRLNSDQKVQGYVLSVSPTEVQVDIGRKHAGYIPVDELSNTPNVKPEDICKVGDVLDLIVMRTNDENGTVMLSKKRFDAIKGWDDMSQAEESREVLSGKVADVVRNREGEIRGLLVASDKGINIFIPASQASMSREDDLTAMKGQDVRFRIIETNRQRRKVVGSIRSVLREERKAEEAAIWQNITVGEKYTGTVKSLTSYGAFVNIGGADGMVHISELSWNRIKHPSEVVNVGDVVEVYVKDVDLDKHKISLGYKKAEDNPWNKFLENYQVDDVVDVTVVNLTSYGAFVRILPGVDGLVHISQIANRRIANPSEVLKVGDAVQAKITDINMETQRISLSIRALIEETPAAEEAAEPAEAVAEDAVVEAVEEKTEE